jgi:G6PDH family F420-dependent oxidoreductase
VTALGYALSSEEHGPNDLIRHAALAEDSGVEFALLSDHFHPWIGDQGESPFVWTTLGGIARETETLRVGTGVTCPTTRLHPANVAQATATASVMFEDRFFLGVGTGERLNEHVTGERWPPHHVRLSMLEEAMAVIRELWSGDLCSHDGPHYTVENAQLFTRPDETPAVAVAAGGVETAAVAGRLGDALVSTAPSAEVVEAFADEAGDDAPRYGQVTACWAESEDEARQTVHECWPNGGLPGELGQELPTPGHFEQAAELVTEADAVENVPCGPDADQFIEAIETFADAGFDHVYLHQVGPDQADFLDFYREEVRPAFE